MPTSTDYSTLSFNARRAALKAMGFSYSDYAKLKNDELLPLLESGKPGKTEILSAHTEAFANRGGKVEVCKPASDKSFAKPSEKQALKKKRTLKKVAKKSSVAKPTGTGDKPARKRTPVKAEGVLLKALIRELNVSGTEARKALRNSGIEKPAKQWIWPEGHPDIAKVKELLTGLES